jgi:ankyrin repeat protein
MLSLSSSMPFDYRTKQLLPEILSLLQSSPSPSSLASSSSQTQHLPLAIVQLVHELITLIPTERLSCYHVHTFTSMMYHMVHNQQIMNNAFIIKHLHEQSLKDAITLKEMKEPQSTISSSSHSLLLLTSLDPSTSDETKSSSSSSLTSINPEVISSYFTAIRKDDSQKVFDLLITGTVTVATRELIGEQWTGLHMAAEFGHLQILHYLLLSGADINAQKSLALGNPLHNASWNGRLNCVTALIQTCKTKDIRTLKSFLNCRTWDGRTPMHYAAGNQHHNVVAVLITEGADHTMKNREGYTPLQFIRDDSKRNELLAMVATKAAATSIV